FDGDADVQRESRMRFVPSGLANEIFLDVYARPASFEPGVTWPQRLFDAYAVETARVDPAGHGVTSAVMGDVDTATDGFADNARLFLPATAFNRFAVTREINDGLLGPRFAPSQRAWILTGTRVSVRPAVPASAGRDSDARWGRPLPGRLHEQNGGCRNAKDAAESRPTWRRSLAPSECIGPL